MQRAVARRLPVTLGLHNTAVLMESLSKRQARGVGKVCAARDSG